ncbi:hypothetical protein [Burkholderia cenocepacia]|uniref:hypothetical protein n=1 Tax=Burkholderia cenocepacia TaxID=95486 RepID=UPI002237DB60|nr:hypothetical protein [Burkholderia cenocepacia]MCW5141072.1 hypothetical protein [Burkholderia cenocepacia]
MTQAPAPDVRIDWFRVLDDLNRGGFSVARLSRITSIPRTSLNNYRYGAEPAHAVGMCILRHWSIQTGRDIADAPLVRRFTLQAVRK